MDAWMGAVGQEGTVRGRNRQRPNGVAQGNLCYYCFRLSRAKPYAHMATKDIDACVLREPSFARPPPSSRSKASAWCLLGPRLA